MKRHSSVWLTAFSFLFLVACKTHSTGSEFIGKWVSSANPANTVLIQRDGDNFVISKANQTFVATYSDGALKYELGGVPTQCTYAPETEVLNCFETDYTRG